MVEFDAGGKFGKLFEGIKVPALREFCDLTNPNKDILFNVEIKEKTNEAVDIAIKILKEYDLVDRCVFTCSDANIIAYLHDFFEIYL